MQRFSRTFVSAALFVMLAFPLTACGDDEGDPNSAVKIYASDETGVAQCKTDHPEQAEKCDGALTGAQKEHEETAQHYTLSDCMSQYGASACQPRESGSYFVPAMAGFMFGYALGGPPVYHPVYVNLSGQAYYGRTVIGAYRPGAVTYVTPPRNAVWVRQYNVRTVSIPPSTPRSPPSYNYGAPRIERGGIGSASGMSAKAPAPAPVSHTSSSSPSISRGGMGGSSSGGVSGG